MEERKEREEIEEESTDNTGNAHSQAGIGNHSPGRDHIDEILPSPSNIL